MSSSKEAMKAARSRLKFLTDDNAFRANMHFSFEQGFEAAVAAMLEYFTGIEVIGDEEGVREDIQNMHRLFYQMLERWANE